MEFIDNIKMEFKGNKTLLSDVTIVDSEAICKPRNDEQIINIFLTHRQ